MSRDDWKTLRVPPEAYKEAKKQKDKHDRTWGQQLTHSETHDGPEVNIEVVDMETGESGLSRDDVETIVETWVENNYERLRKGNL